MWRRAKNYFGFTVFLPQPNTDVFLNSIIQNDRALLLKAVNEQGNTNQWHKFAIDLYPADIPGLTSVTQFVQTLRHQRERDGLQAIKSEVYLTIGGREFVVSELMMQSEREQYYEAIMFTRTKGYLLGFWIEAKNQEQLHKATNLEGKIKFR